MVYVCTSQFLGSSLCFPATGMKNNEKTRIGFETWLHSLPPDGLDCLRRMEFGLKPETVQSLPRGAWETMLAADNPTDCFLVRLI